MLHGVFFFNNGLLNDDSKEVSVERLVTCVCGKGQLCFEDSE